MYDIIGHFQSFTAIFQKRLKDRRNSISLLAFVDFSNFWVPKSYILHAVNFTLRTVYFRWVAVHFSIRPFTLWPRSFEPLMTIYFPTSTFMRGKVHKKYACLSSSAIIYHYSRLIGERSFLSAGYCSKKIVIIQIFESHFLHLLLNSYKYKCQNSN